MFVQTMIEVTRDIPSDHSIVLWVWDGVRQCFVESDLCLGLSQPPSSEKKVVLLINQLVPQKDITS